MHPSAPEMRPRCGRDAPRRTEMRLELDLNFSGSWPPRRHGQESQRWRRVDHEALVLISRLRNLAAICGKPGRSSCRRHGCSPRRSFPVCSPSIPHRRQKSGSSVVRARDELEVRFILLSSMLRGTCFPCNALEHVAWCALAASPLSTSVTCAFSHADRICEMQSLLARRGATSATLV